MDPKGKMKEPATPKSSDDDAQKGGLSSDDDEGKQERLKRVKMQMSKRAEGKARRAEEKKKKKEAKTGGKKDKKQGWKDKFQFIAKLFSGNKAEKAKKKALSNIANKNVGNVGEGDITFKGGKTTDLEDDVWMEEPSVLTNTQHRDNLNLVKNNDNDGHLFHENKRPFWKNPIFAKEHPPIPEQKPSSTLLVQVVNEGKQLAEPLDAPDYFDWTDNFVDLIARDERHFKNEQMLANTIRSVINTMFDEKDLRQQQASTDRELNEPRETVRVTEPPAEQTLYSRHHWELQRKDVFKKALSGKPRKKEKSPAPSSSSSDSDKK